MLIDANFNSPLYQTYRHSGPTIALIGSALVINIIAIPGVLMNAFVILTTIYNRNLRGSANYLMALISLFESVHQFGHLVFLAIVASGINFVDMQTATLITTPQIFALNANLISMFCAAFDRLLAVASNDWHSKIYSKYRRAYLVGQSLFITIYAAFCTSLIIAYGIQNPDIPTTGCIGEILIQLGMKWYATTSFPMLGSILCYALIGAIVRRNKSVTNQTNTRLLRSLILILTVSVGGYLVGISAYQILFNFDWGLGQIALWELSFIPGAILNIGAAANAPILYMNSTEYRNAFKRQLGALFPRLVKALKLTILTSVQQVNNNSLHQNSSLFQQRRPPKDGQQLVGVNGGRRISVWSTTLNGNNPN